MKYSPEQVRQIIKEKVEGKIITCHTLQEHRYKFVDSGEIVKSVTTKNILDKPHIVPWAIGLAIDFLEGKWERLSGPERDSLIKGAKLQYIDNRDSAGSIGTKAHLIIESYEKQWIETGIRPASIMPFIPEGSLPQVIGACRSAEAAFDKYKVVPVAFELLVGIPSTKTIEGGAGTLDLIVMDEQGNLELWDWKSSNSINDFYACQTSAYEKFFRKMTKLKVKKIRIFKIDKWSNKFKVYLVTDPLKAYRAYKNISATHSWVYDGEDKLKEDRIIIKI